MKIVKLTPSQARNLYTRFPLYIKEYEGWVYRDGLYQFNIPPHESNTYGIDEKNLCSMIKLFYNINL